MSDTKDMTHFDEEHAERYDDQWKPLAPLHESFHLQLCWALQEMPENARILCVGAGTGAELLALARRFPAWRFLAVDPSPPMLSICRRKAMDQGIGDRCEFVDGFVHQIPDTEAKFDAATSILVSHFIVDRVERLTFFREIRRRLRDGGMLVSSDLSEAPRGQQSELMAIWVRMMAHAGATEEQISGMLKSYDESVSMFSEEAMESLLVEAGFIRPTLFNQSLLIRSWLSRAG